MVAYATTPLLLPETFENSHGMRFQQADVLEELGNEYGVSKWTEASELFRRSVARIIELSKSASNQEKQRASTFLVEIADIEEQAYRLLKDG